MTETPEPADNVVRLIVGGFDGKLTTAKGAHVPVRVFERGGRDLMVILMVAPDEPLDGKAALLEYAGARGLIRLRGEATVEGRDLVCFHCDEEPEILQRREFVRVEAVQPVVLIADEDGAVLSGHAIEVSGGGMLVTGPDTLALDTAVRFSLHLGGGAIPISGRGRVVRVEGGGRRALVFDEISHADRQRLIHFVFERQRDALAKGAQVAPLNRKRRRSEG
jgi:hypothetical protein